MTRSCPISVWVIVLSRPRPSGQAGLSILLHIQIPPCDWHQTSCMSVVFYHVEPLVNFPPSIHCNLYNDIQACCSCIHAALWQTWSTKWAIQQQRLCSAMTHSRSSLVSAQPSLRIGQPKSGTGPDALRVQLFAQWDSDSLIPPTPREQSMTDKVTWHIRSWVSAQYSPRNGPTRRLAGHRHSGSAVVDWTTRLCLNSPLCEQIPNCTASVNPKLDLPSFIDMALPPFVKVALASLIVVIVIDLCHRHRCHIHRHRRHIHLKVLLSSRSAFIFVISSSSRSVKKLNRLLPMFFLLGFIHYLQTQHRVSSVYHGSSVDRVNIGSSHALMVHDGVAWWWRGSLSVEWMRLIITVSIWWYWGCSKLLQVEGKIYSIFHPKITSEIHCNSRNSKFTRDLWERKKRRICSKERRLRASQNTLRKVLKYSQESIVGILEMEDDTHKSIHYSRHITTGQHERRSERE